jgi:hypothetical protein
MFALPASVPNSASRARHFGRGARIPSTLITSISRPWSKAMPRRNCELVAVVRFQRIALVLSLKAANVLGYEGRDATEEFYFAVGKPVIGSSLGKPQTRRGTPK